MPPQRLRRRTVSRYPSRNRVKMISRLSQWGRLHKRGKNHLIFVMFTLEYVKNAHRLKTTLAELSAHNEFQKVLFAVVDIEKGAEIAQQEGINDVPTFIMYQNGAVIEKMERVTSEAAPATIWQMLHRNVVRMRTESANAATEPQRVPRWRRLARPILAIVAVAAGAVAFFFATRDKEDVQDDSTFFTTRRRIEDSRRARSKNKEALNSDESSDDNF